MSNLSNNPELKEINALKKKLNWGEVPAIYHMVSTSVGELDGILTHGFESGYTNILNKERWNLPKLGGTRDKDGIISIQYKPKISLRHVYNEMGYELHCFPNVLGERVNRNMINHPDCPFKSWIPEADRRLFRINSLANFVIYIVQKGDEADYAMIKYIYRRVEQLIDILAESFDIKEVRGYNLAEFFQEINSRKDNTAPLGMLDNINDEVE
ncbi:hypothetical protein [Colwellia sp. MEBiC06753]